MPGARHQASALPISRESALIVVAFSSARFMTGFSKMETTTEAEPITLLGAFGSGACKAALADDDAKRLLRDCHFCVIIGVCFFLDDDRDPVHPFKAAQRLGGLLQNLVNVHHGNCLIVWIV